jgi:transposase
VVELVERFARVISCRSVRDPGANIAGLYTLVATCEARGITPFAYLADVIPRVQDHPKRRLDETLPGPWSRAQPSA